MGLPSERELIDAITRQLSSTANRAGLASDSAVVPLDGVELVATVDGFADETHFPDGLPYRLAGRIAGRGALGDLAAAGANVLGVLTALGVPGGLDGEDVVELVRGVQGVVEAAGGEVLGGDTKPREQLTVTITGLGRCPEGTAMTRDRARPGQLLLLTGPLGGAGAALDRLSEGLDPSDAQPLVPPDRTAAGRALRKAGVRCAMDLSDGLADAAVAISKASGVQIRLDAARIPLHGWARNDAGLGHALSTGGDYELVATVDRGELDRIVDRLEGLDLSPTVVGEVQEGRGALLEPENGGQEAVSLDRGYEHDFEPTRESHDT